MHFLLKSLVICFFLSLLSVGLFAQVTEKQVVFNDLEKALLSPDQVEVLILKREKYTQWPAELNQFTNLRKLDLSNNRITQLPRDLSGFEDLEELDLTGNKLDSLPNSIGDLISIKKLLIGNNEIYHVSERVGDLKNLEYFELWSNNIYYLPAGISELENLVEVDLRGIQMSEEHQEAIKFLFTPQVNVRLSISCNCD